MKEHRMMGFTIYYEKFFDRFNTIKDLDKYISKGVIDINFTYNPILINYTPKQQICCQIVSKYSTKSKCNTNNYIKLYEITDEKLKIL